MNCTGRMRDGIYNCYGVYDHAMCYDCKYNSDSKAKEKKSNFVNFKDKFDVLYDYLRGKKLPDGVICQTPKLSDNKAFSLIWFLQEIMHCLPDNIEQCRGCKELFDADSSGYCLSGEYKLNNKTLPKRYWGDWCDSCVPDIDFKSP